MDQCHRGRGNLRLSHAIPSSSETQARTLVTTEKNVPGFTSAHLQVARGLVKVPSDGVKKRLEPGKREMIHTRIGKKDKCSRAPRTSRVSTAGGNQSTTLGSEKEYVIGRSMGSGPSGGHVGERSA